MNTATAENKIVYTVSAYNFTKIPGSPIAYWVNEVLLIHFSNDRSLGDAIELKKGMSTGDNARFMRFWFEVHLSKIGFSLLKNNVMRTVYKWFPINSGGEFRKWYGNNYYIVNWENDGEEMKQNAVKLNNGGHWSRYIVNVDKFFLSGLTWSAISSGKFGARFFDNGFLFSSASMCGFCANELFYILALLNSRVSESIITFLAPTLNFGPEQIRKIPFCEEEVDEVETITDKSIKLAREDWDSFEISWDFKKHPLI